MFMNKLKHFIKNLFGKLSTNLKNSTSKWDETRIIKIQQKGAKSLKFLSNPESRPQIHFLFGLIVLALFSFWVPRFIGLTLTPKPLPPKGNLTQSELLDFSLNMENTLAEMEQQVNSLRNSDPFKTENSDQSQLSELNKICENSTLPSSLSFQLLSTIVMQNTQKSLASVSTRGKNSAGNYRLGDKLESSARIDQIERLRIIFRNLKNGQCEFISNTYFNPKNDRIKVMESSAGKAFVSQQNLNESIKNDGNNFQISRSYLQSKLTDINSILTQARGIPITNPDGTLSFRIEDVEPGGLFPHLGINNGDVISKINGRAITNFNEVMNMFNQLKNMKNLNLTLLRNGVETPQQYEFNE